MPTILWQKKKEVEVLEVEQAGNHSSVRNAKCYNMYSTSEMMLIIMVYVYLYKSP